MSDKKEKLEDKKLSDYNLNDIAQLLKWPMIIFLIALGGIFLWGVLSSL